MRFPGKKNAGCPKAPRDFPTRFPNKKKWHSPPSGLSWNSPPPPPESVRTGAQPKSLRSIGYQICLAMLLRWRASVQAPL